MQEYIPLFMYKGDIVVLEIVHTNRRWFCGVVVITSALHAEGREFEPRQNLRVNFVSVIRNY